MDINYKLVLDTVEFNQSVQSGLNQLRLFKEELAKTKSVAGQAFASSALDTDKLAGKMQEVINLNGQMLGEFQKLGAAIKGATSTNEVQQLNAEIAKLKAQIDALSNSAGGGSGLGGKMGNLKNQLVQLRIEGKQNTDQYQKLNAEYSKMVANITAVENASKQYRNTNKELVASVDDTGRVAALAGANVISFGQILSDLPYGIRGVANNMQQLTATMVTLVVQAGGLKAAMVALRSTFLGPLGIIVAVQGAIAALDFFAGSTEKVKKAKEDATEANDKYIKSLADEKAEMEILFEATTKMIKNGEDLNKIKSIAEEINDKYNTDLNTEKLTVEDIGKAYTIVNNNIKEKIALQATQDSLIRAYEGELKAQDKLNELYGQQKDLIEELNKVKPGPSEERDRALILAKQAELQQIIDKFEQNRVGHIANQGILLQKAADIYADIYKAKDDEDGKDKKRIKADIEAIKDIQDDFADRNDAIKKLTNDMIKYVAEGGNLMTFEGSLYIQNWVKGLSGEVEKVQDEITKKVKPIKSEGAIAEWLGISDREVELMLKNIRIIGRELSNIFNEFNEAAQRNNKNVIESLDDVIAKTEEKIATETELQQMGLANNLEAEKTYLDQQKQLREEAYERQKQLELQKLAIDSISQLSSLITASAQIWQSTSKVPQPFGSALAIAAIGAMFGSFAVSKVKAAQLVKSQESFEEGGVVQGKRHTQGGERFYSQDGNHMVEIEQGEYVTNRESTRKYMDLLHAINNDEIGSHNIHKLLEGTGVTVPSMDTEAFKKDLKVISTGNSSPKQNATNTPDLSQDIKDIKKYVKGIAEKETVYNDGNKTIVKRGNKTTTIRRGN